MSAMASMCDPIIFTCKYKWSIQDFKEQISHKTVKNNGFMLFESPTFVDKCARDWRLEAKYCDRSYTLSLKAFPLSYPSQSIYVNCTTYGKDPPDTSFGQGGSGCYELSYNDIESYTRNTKNKGISFKNVIHTNDVRFERTFIDDDALVINANIIVLTESIYEIKNKPTGYKRDMEKLYKSDDGKDITLISGGSKKHKAHKLILRARSKKLKELIDSTEQEQNLDKSIKFADLSDLDMEQLMMYMYTGSVEEKGNYSSVRLFKTACEYGMEDLKTQCEEHMLVFLSMTTVFKILSLQKDNDMGEHWLKVTRRYLAKNFDNIIKLPGWPTFLMNNTEFVSRALKEVSAN